MESRCGKAGGAHAEPGAQPKTMKRSEQNSARIGGIILAGGGSRRMGTPKATLLLPRGAATNPPAGGSGKAHIASPEDTFVGLVAAAMQCVAGEIIISVQPGSEIEVPKLGVPVRAVLDDVADAGPVAGLAAALETLRDRADIAIVCPCDAPLVSPAVFRLLAELGRSHRAVICEGSGRPAPLLGAYRTEDAAVARDLVQSGERRAMAFAEAVGAFVIPESELRRVDPELRALRNINTPEDYAELKREAGTGID